MTNLFLKVNKDLFKLSLTPIEILILAQVMEYDTNTGKCFISDAAMAEAFGVSTKTISRSVANLESKGFIKRDTKYIKGGRERTIAPNITAIELALTKDNLSVVDNSQEDVQQTICLLTTDNLSLVQGQNDLIKDNIKDKEKDNICVLLPNGNKTETALKSSFNSEPGEGKPFNELTKSEKQEKFKKEFGF